MNEHGDRILVKDGSPKCEVRRMDAPLILSLGIAVDVNRAELPELATLPGVGPGLARRIAAHRQRHGPYRQKDEVLRVRGIGPRTRAALEPWLAFEDVPARCAPLH